MAGRVHQVEDIILAVTGLVIQPHGLRLDGDAALFFDVHRIEHLLRHLPRLQPAGGLDQPVGKRRFAMVDMGDDGEIADMGEGEGHGRADSGGRGKRQGRAGLRYSSALSEKALSRFRNAFGIELRLLKYASTQTISYCDPRQRCLQHLN